MHGRKFRPMAAQDLPGTDHSEQRDCASVLDSLRQLNRELLVAASANIPQTVADCIDQARDNVTRAIRLLSQPGDKVPAEELPANEFRAMAQSSPAANHLRDTLGDSARH